MSKLQELVAAATSALSLAKASFERKPGTGALFVFADNDTGEVARIEGVFCTPAPAKFELRFEGKIVDSDSISLLGTVVGQPKSKVIGMLRPVSYADDTRSAKIKAAEKDAGLDVEDDPYAGSYKKGHITIVGGNGKELTCKVNSKIKLAKNGDPYRFIWFTHDQTRVAF